MWDFLLSIMRPIHAAISFVLMWAYRGWSYVLGADRGITWVLAIASLVIIVRTLLIPLFVRQINSARNMQVIQPKMKALQDKYGADRQRLGIETQKLMKEEGVSPTASCVPLLLQMPIFFALYQVLYQASQGEPLGVFVDNRELVDSLLHAKFLGASLAGTFWPVDPFGPTQILALILVALMTTFLFITQKQMMGKNMPASAMTGPMAQQQKMMLYIFPFMYIFMGAIIPVGVLIYWVTNNLWTLCQQFIMIRNNPTPGTPAFIEWEERMIKQGKDPKQIAAERQAKRSKKPTQPPNQGPSDGRRPGGDGRKKPDNGSGEDDAGGTATGGVPRGGPKGTGGSGGTGQGSAADNGFQGVQRQQIQRQQPGRQSRAVRKKK